MGTPKESAGRRSGAPGVCERKENTLQPEQTVSEMANEVLRRQAKARADRGGEPIEEAMEMLREQQREEHGVEALELVATEEKVWGCAAPSCGR
jgi:hypothetical protein